MNFTIIVRKPSVVKASVPYCGADANAAQKAFEKAAAEKKDSIVEMWRHEKSGTARRFRIVDNVATAKQKEAAKAAKDAEKKAAEEKKAAQAEEKKAAVKAAQDLLAKEGFDVKEKSDG